MNNMNYLNHATDFPGNSWKCDPNKDSFVQISAEGEGEIGVCSEVHTKFKVGEIDLKEKEWRDVKRDLVHNCLYSCPYESQNPNLRGDSTTLGVIAQIKSGNAEGVERYGQLAVRALDLVPDFEGTDRIFKPLLTNPIFLFLVQSKGNQIQKKYESKSLLEFLRRSYLGM